MSIKYHLHVLMLVVVTSWGCNTQQVTGNCKRDADCPQGFHCTPDHQCHCSPGACESGFFCNTAGFCQKYEGCLLNSECGDSSLWACELVHEGKGVCKCKSNQACNENEHCSIQGVCEIKHGCLIDADCGDQQDHLCKINQETKIGECLCKTDAACSAGEFCNSHNFCQEIQGCKENDDCQTGRFCDVESRECLCNAEAQTGCKADEVCNSSGYCQPRPGCFDNNDCRHLSDTYCDTSTKTCVPRGQCASDRQCELGSICKNQAGKHICIPGCNQHADCPLDQYCNNYQCVQGCQGDEYCGFAEQCTNGRCQRVFSERTPVCRACNNDDALSCGDRNHSCLIYPYENDEFVRQDPFLRQPTEYCALDCSQGERCPNGFACRSVITISPVDSCSKDSDCPSGLPCLKSAEEDTGYCPCTKDNRNPCEFPNYCNRSMSRCTMLKKCTGRLAGIPCTTNADCSFCNTTGQPCSSRH